MILPPSRSGNVLWVMGTPWGLAVPALLLFTEAFVKLQEENLSIPRPRLPYKIWRSSHPPLGKRIDFCNEYRPWETGQPLKYEDKVR